MGICRLECSKRDSGLATVYCGITDDLFMIRAGWGGRWADVRAAAVAAGIQGFTLCPIPI